MTRTVAGTTALIVWFTGCSTSGNDASGTDSTSEETSLEVAGNATSTSGGTTSKSPTSGNTAQSSAPSSTGATSSTRPNTTSAGAPEDSEDDVEPGTTDVTSNIDTPTDATQSAQPESSDSDATEASDTTQGATSEGDGSDETSSSENTEPGEDVVDLGADDKFSFFVTSYYHLALLSGSEDGFGGDLRYDGAATGLEGADAICQEIARRVSFGNRTWRAYLSTSSVNAIDRIGEGPWYDFVGALVADSKAALTSGGDRFPGGCCEEGTYDEMGLFHDGATDQNNDGIDDDDHDTMTATQEDGTYSGFSCEDWTSTTATAPASGGGQGGGQGGGGQGGGGPGRGGGIMMGHSWPAQSGQHWATSHGGHNCAAGTNFIQNGAGDSSSVGGGGGYGGFYCFALPE